MASEKLEQSLAPGGAHHFLTRLIGDWRGSTKTWFEPDKLADESPISGGIRPLFDGRFVRLAYQGELMGKPFEGEFIFGFNLQREKYEASWIDSFHMGTAMMACEGERSADGFWVLGHYDAPEGPPWGWRTELTLDSAQSLVITMYNIQPDGVEAKGVQMTLSRVDPS